MNYLDSPRGGGDGCDTHKNVDCSQSSFFHKIIEIERFALRAAILHECQNYSVHLKIKAPVTVRRGISKRSHEKKGDCEQSNKNVTGMLVGKLKSIRF